MAAEGHEVAGEASIYDLLRPGHNPARPAVDTAEAASQLKITRQAVVQAIQRGSLDGYGIPGPQRVRWWVYRDALEHRMADPDLRERYEDLLRRHRTLQVEAAVLQETLEQRNRAYRLLRQSDEHLLQALSTLRQAFAELDDATSNNARLTETLVPNPTDRMS